MDSTIRRVALVTGASRGIGRAIAERLAGAGYDLTISARDLSSLERAAEVMRLAGASVRAVTADMSSEGDVAALSQGHQGAFDRLDVLVICAGVGMYGRVEDYPLRRLDKQIAINLRAPFQLVRDCLPILKKTASLEPTRGTKIIVLTSLTGIVPELGLAAYAATKAGLNSFCESVNLEMSSLGISATALAPGYVDTEMSRWVHERVPPETMITTEDVAELAMALTRLSAKSVVAQIPISRAGVEFWRA